MVGHSSPRSEFEVSKSTVIRIKLWQSMPNWTCYLVWEWQRTSPESFLDNMWLVHYDREFEGEAVRKMVPDSSVFLGYYKANGSCPSMEIKCAKWLW